MEKTGTQSKRCRELITVSQLLSKRQTACRSCSHAMSQRARADWISSFSVRGASKSSRLPVALWGFSFAWGNVLGEIRYFI